MPTNLPPRHVEPIGLRIMTVLVTAVVWLWALLALAVGAVLFFLFMPIMWLWMGLNALLRRRI